MKKFNLLLAGLLLFVQPLYHAQIIDTVKNDFFHTLNMGGSLASSFTSFDDTKAWDLAGTAAAIAVGYSIDNNIKDFSQKNVNSLNNHIFIIDNIYGNGYTLIGIVGVYSYGLFLNDPGVRKIGLQTIQAVGYAGLITSILKSIVGRSRPYTNSGKANYHPFNTQAAETSFPSGHATVSFAVSTVLANNTDNIFLKILCYAASGWVDCSRIYHNDHWLSDVIAGSAIGYFVGNYVTSNYDKTENNNSGLSFYYSPTSLGFSYSF